MKTKASLAYVIVSAGARRLDTGFDARHAEHYADGRALPGIVPMAEPKGPIFGIAETLVPRIRRPSDKNENDVYSGSVLLPGHRDRARAYFKVFPPARRRQLVFNEIMAHKIAIQLGLASPLTFPCVCRPSALRAATRGLMAADGEQLVLGVASIDGAPNAIKQQSLIELPTTWADLMNWPDAARAAVFDELMANDDRHLDNLVRCGPRDFVLIDGERIVFAEDWFGKDLTLYRLKRCEANALASTIAEGTDEVARARMQQCAEFYVRVVQLTVPEEADAIESICRAPRGSTAQLVEFLNYRRTSLPSLMHWHLTRGDIFQARSHK